MTMIMRLERTSEEVKTRARHVIICDNYPEKHRVGGVYRRIVITGFGNPLLRLSGTISEGTPQKNSTIRV